MSFKDLYSGPFYPVTEWRPVSQESAQEPAPEPHWGERTPVSFVEPPEISIERRWIRFSLRLSLDSLQEPSET